MSLECHRSRSVDYKRRGSRAKYSLIVVERRTRAYLAFAAVRMAWLVRIMAIYHARIRSFFRTPLRTESGRTTRAPSIKAISINGECVMSILASQIKSTQVETTSTSDIAAIGFFINLD